MKKLVVIASALVLGFAANAASFTWGFTGGGEMDLWMPDGSDYLSSGTAFLFLGSVTATESAFDLSGATFVTKGGYNEESYDFGKTSKADLANSELVNAAAGQAYSLVLVDKVVDSLEGYEGSYYLASGESGLQSIPGATTTYYATFVNEDAVMPGSWSTMESVPEPTSGLLLLLGMAGLALRRKQA